MIQRQPTPRTANLATQQFEAALTATERSRLAKLTTPARIQSFVDDLDYSCDDFYRSPLRVVRERTGHCFDGALFAAAMLARIGEPPLLLDLLPNGRDDDHVLALFKRNGCWGAIAKSNFVGLRYREPVYRNLRELVMSFFEHYFNAAREKTLVGYTRPLNLNAFGKEPWMTEDSPLERIADGLDARPRHRILSAPMARALEPVDPLTFRAGMLVARKAGLYKV